MRNQLSFSILKREFPKVFKEYMKHPEYHHIGFMGSMDNFLYSYGIGVIVCPVYYGNTDKIINCDSYLQFYPDNKINATPERIPYLQNSRKYKDMRKARTLTTLEALKTLEYKLPFIHIEPVKA